jgi:hypothetical protein
MKPFQKLCRHSREFALAIRNRKESANVAPQTCAIVLLLIRHAEHKRRESRVRPKKKH